MIEYVVKVYSYQTEWFLDGNYHREDGPAIEFASGTKYWCKNGLLHREDGPACEFVSGSKYWYKNGLRHRLDGPACELSDGTKFWYLEGVELTEEDFLQRKKPCSGKKVTVDGVDYELV